MLKGLIFWKFTYISYLVAFLLAFMLIAVQIFRLGNVIFGLPPDKSLPFLFLWFSNYSLFFVPDGVFVAGVFIAFWLKERKLLQVIYSFGISPLRIASYILVPSLAFFLLQLAFSHTLNEERVAYARKSLILHYKDRIIQNLSEKTFLRTESLVIYAEKKEKGAFRNLFFKHKDLTVLAQRAVYRGDEEFLFEKGSVLTREAGKFLLTEFESYRLNLGGNISNIKYRESRAKRSIVTNILNSFMTVPMGIGGFLITLRYVNTHLRSYYLMAGGVILHQIVMLLIKLSL